MEGMRKKSNCKGLLVEEGSGAVQCSVANIKYGVVSCNRGSPMLELGNT